MTDVSETPISEDALVFVPYTASISMTCSKFGKRGGVEQLETWDEVAQAEVRLLEEYKKKRETDRQYWIDGKLHFKILRLLQSVPYLTSR